MNKSLTYIIFIIPLLFSSHILLSGEIVDTNIIFSSGFEEGGKSIWDDYDNNPNETNLIMLDPGPFGKQGNHVMRLRVPPGRGGADIVKVLPGSYDKLYLRWYQKWEPGYDFNAKNHGGGLYAGSRNLLGRSGIRPDGTDLFCAFLEPIEHRMNFYTYYRGMYMDCVDPNGMCWGDHFPCWLDEGERICKKPEHREKIMPPIMETGRWYCFEMTIDAGKPVESDDEADGSMNFWIDGIEYGPFNNLWLRTTPDLKINILWLELFHHEAHSVEGILLDDIVVSKERIGCGTSNIMMSEYDNTSISLTQYSFPELISISYQLFESGNIKIDIYNNLGELITTIVDEWQEAGKHNEELRMNNEKFPAGMYYYRIQIGERVESGKLILIR